MACSVCNQAGHTKRTCKQVPVAKPDAVVTVQQTKMAYTYEQIIQAIKDACANIIHVFSTNSDGRNTSAFEERPYLNQIEKWLKENHPSLKFEHQPKPRHWWDFSVNGLPIDLKLTTGNADDACNKVAIIYTITAVEPKNKNMNFNKFNEILHSSSFKANRDRMTEFHYLAVNKKTGEFLLKSILDIHTYKTNPSNDLQINWKNEFLNISYMCSDFEEKSEQLINTLQNSVNQCIEGKKEFACTDIKALFAKKKAQ